MSKQREAYRGCLTGYGSTASAAKRDLDEQVDRALDAKNRPHIECRNGYVLTVCATPHGWERYVIHPDQIEAGNGKQPSLCFLGWCDRNEAIEGGRMHIAQLSWNFDCNDGQHLAQAGLSDAGQRDLMSWIKFQRSYREAKEAGKNDAEAFAIASNDPRYHQQQAA